MSRSGWTSVSGGDRHWERSYPGGKVGHVLWRGRDWGGFHDGNFIGSSPDLTVAQAIIDQVGLPR